MRHVPLLYQRNTERHGHREQQEGDEGQRIEPDRAEDEPVPDHDEEREVHHRLEHEVHERDTDGRERKDLAREVHLLHQVGVRDDGLRTRAERDGEEVPREQPAEQEDRVIVDGGPEHLRDEGEDGEEHDRVEERPDGPEHGADVLDLELLADEVEQHLPVVPQLAQTLPQPQVRRLGCAFRGSGCGRDRGCSSDGGTEERAGQGESNKGPSGGRRAASFVTELLRFSTSRHARPRSVRTDQSGLGSRRCWKSLSNRGNVRSSQYASSNARRAFRDSSAPSAASSRSRRTASARPSTSPWRREKPHAYRWIASSTLVPTGPT